MGSGINGGKKSPVRTVMTTTTEEEEALSSTGKRGSYPLNLA